MHNIPYSCLPQTFRDAVAVTRRLGIPYLWIDSLCIIQDSPDDWAAESARMAYIYENAFVTIAADAAVDSRTGFLNPPARHLALVIGIEYQKENKTTGCVYVREKGALAWQVPYHSWHFGTMASPNSGRQAYSMPKSPPRSKLSTRGWVFQERILSPRTLYFAESELAWECRSAIACECSATSERKRRGESLLKGSLARQSWKQLVQEFSALDLTVDTDRLPAMSGLAEAMSRLMPGDEYVCGLWKGQLAEQLLWYVPNKQNTANLPSKKESKKFEEYYAPTWSWASITGQVCYKNSPYPKVSKTFDIIDVHFRAKLNRFGPVSSAYILVSGLVVSVKVSLQPTGGNPGHEICCSYAVPAQQSKDLKVNLLFDVSMSEHMSHVDDGSKTFLFLLLAEGIGAPHGLILVPAGYRDEGEVFERVGYGHATYAREETEYSSDEDSDLDWDSEAAVMAWQKWASIAEQRTLKLV